jgi:hypothetical protein
MPSCELQRRHPAFPFELHIQQQKAAFSAANEHPSVSDPNQLTRSPGAAMHGQGAMDF